MTTTSQIWSAAQVALDKGRAPLDDAQVQALIAAALDSEATATGIPELLSQLAGLEQTLKHIERPLPVAAQPRAKRPLFASAAAALLIFVAIQSPPGSTALPITASNALAPPRAFIKSLTITTEHSNTASSPNAAALVSTTTYSTQINR